MLFAQYKTIYKSAKISKAKYIYMHLLEKKNPIIHQKHSAKFVNII
jgi:hypothetical protein